MNKNKSQPYYDYYEQQTNLAQERLKPQRLQTHPNKIIIMLESFDEELIEQMKQYLAQHQQEVQDLAKYKKDVIRNRKRRPLDFDKYSLYQNIQSLLILYDYFSKVKGQVKKIGRQWKMQMMKSAAEKIQKVCLQKYCRALSVGSILARIRKLSDITPQILRYCLAKGQNIVFSQKLKIEYPSKQDMKKFFNPLKVSLKAQKVQRKAEQKQGKQKKVIIQIQQEKDLIKSTPRAKIQETLDNNLEIKERHINLDKKARRKEIIIQDQQARNLQRREGIQAFIKFENPFEEKQHIIQSTQLSSQSLRETSQKIQTNENIHSKYLIHPKQTAHLFSNHKNDQQGPLEKTKQPINPNSQIFIHDHKKLPISKNIYQKNQNNENQKRERKSRVSKIIIISILLDLLQELSQ